MNFQPRSPLSSTKIVQATLPPKMVKPPLGGWRIRKFGWTPESTRLHRVYDTRFRGVAVGPGFTHLNVSVAQIARVYQN